MIYNIVMIVFRYTNEQELISILQHNTSNLGGSFSNTNSNTFKYNPNEKYLHFFKKAEDIDHIRKLHRYHTETTFYYCAFDIPVVQLISSMGKGYYDSSGYDTYYTTAREFAIATKRFSPDWLIGYKQDNPSLPFDKSSFESKISSGFKDTISMDCENDI